MRTLLPVFLLLSIAQLKAQQPGNNDTVVYYIKAKLIKAEPLTPGCGIIAWALAQKFKIIESDFSVLKPNYTVLLIEPCPEFTGKQFFVKGGIYDISISKISGAPFGYSVINKYNNETLLTFWIRGIKQSIP